MYCVHQFCIYCDSRSACYQIEDFDGEVLVKVNAIDLLRRELARKRVKGVVGTGSMSDPYMPLEANLGLTRQALQALAQFRYGVHITTKSDLVLRDLDLLCQINRVHASVCLTITTADDELGKRVEPYAPLVSRRFEAARVLVDRGIHVGITLMPVLPFIEDSEDNIAQIVRRAHECGVTRIVPWFGMSIRTGQREYYYDQLDVLFSGLRARYERQYGDRYSCPCPNARRLAQVFHGLCERYGITTEMQRATHQTADQLALF